MNIDCFWANINKKGDHNEIHYHGMCDMAGVFYLKTPEDCGALEFISPNGYVQCKELQWYDEEIRKRCNFYEAYRWIAKESKIFLFPSSLLHKVYPNQTDNDRISASFNVQLHLEK